MTRTARWLRRARHAVALLVVAATVAFGAAQAVPSSWLRAVPAGDPARADTLIILSFGFLEDADGTVRPGASNVFLLRWALERFPHVTTAFVQEGVWTAACPQSARTCQVQGVRLLRIDRYRKGVDLHTPSVAQCAVERMQQFGRTRAVLVAQPLQLGRAADDFARVIRQRCPECELVVPEVPDVPYEPRSVQIRTRAEWLYKPVDELAVAIGAIPGDPIGPDSCPMPMPPGE